MKIDLRDYTPDISDEELKEGEPYLKTRASIQKQMSDYSNTLVLRRIDHSPLDAWKTAQSELLHAHGEEYRDIYLMHRVILLALEELMPPKEA